MMKSQDLFDAIVDSAILLDRAGKIINWNAAATTLFGYSRKEVLGRSVNLIYDKNYPFSKLIQDINLQQKKWQKDTSFVHKNGFKGNCKSYLCAIKPADDEVIALLIHQNTSQYKDMEKNFKQLVEKLFLQLQQDYYAMLSTQVLIIKLLQELEQADKKLRESEIRFRLLAENATDMISRHSPDGNFLYSSPASKNIIGFSPEELMGKNIYKFVHHDDHLRLRKNFCRRRSGYINKPIIYRMKRKEGEFRWVECNLRLITDEHTQIINEVQLAMRDVTDRILDKKARLRGQQLAHIFRLSSMEEMASGIAHEISQPLTAIIHYTRGCVRHLENELNDQEQLKTVMEKAVVQAERAGEIVQRLKNFFCKGQLLKTPCKINNLIRETISLIKHELISSKTKIDLNFDKNLCLIFIDRIQIQQVILNLIQNAIESMQESLIKEKRIKIQTQAVANRSVEVTLSDTGIGFAKDIISKVFKPFFTTKAHGRGMGLAISRSIVEAHGGQFTIHPNTHGNSFIRFSLPITN